MLKLKTTLLYFDVEDINGQIFKQNNINLTKVVYNANNYSLYGELGHPDTFDISLSEVSHCFHKIYIEKNRLIGELQVLNTNTGKVLNEIIKTTMSIKNINNFGDIEKIKFHRLVKLSKSKQLIDLDLYNCSIAFRMRYIKGITNNNEVIVKDVYTFDAITNEEDNFKNINK